MVIATIGSVKSSEVFSVAIQTWINVVHRRVVLSCHDQIEGIVKACASAPGRRSQGRLLKCEGGKPGAEIGSTIATILAAPLLGAGPQEIL